MSAERPYRTLGLSLLTRAVCDLVKGLYFFHFVGPCVTVFGSARIGIDTPVYETARALGRALSRVGFTIMTGGGPGLMEAVSRGVRDAGGCSVGCRMSFAFEQQRNSYLDHCVTFKYFFVRKVMLCRYAYAFVALPGGLGTLDELFEVLTLMQTRKIPPVPVVLVGSEYWEPCLKLLEWMALEGTLSHSDLGLIHVTDDVEQVIAYIKDTTQPIFNLHGALPPWARPEMVQ